MNMIKYISTYIGFVIYIEKFVIVTCEDEVLQHMNGSQEIGANSSHYSSSHVKRRYSCRTGAPNIFESTIKFHICCLRHIRRSLHRDVANTMTACAAGTRLDYCRALLDEKSLNGMQRVRNKLDRVVYNVAAR